MTSCENEMKTYIAKLLLREGIPVQRVINSLNGEGYVTTGNSCTDAVDTNIKMLNWINSN